MKLNNLQKNFCIFFSVIISIFIVTLLWEKINLPLNNITGAKGPLVLKGYNPTNDTIRYILFISLPLIVYLFLNQILKGKPLRIRELIEEKKENVANNHPALLVLTLIFVIFIFLEFFSVNFAFTDYKIDQMHDGTYLVPAQNYWSTKNIWKSTFLVHGSADMFYPLLMWKIFGVQSIGSTRVFTIFIILFLKLLSVLLSYQITKISNLNRESKILFFTIFTSILLSMSIYSFTGTGYYLSYKDIYIILFLILFIELFIQSKFRPLIIFLICLLATITILFQIDRGVYIYFILTFYCLYLLVAKKYIDLLLFFSSLVACWFVAIASIGLEELKAFLDNSKTMILSMDLMHGLKYPEPFFSMENNPNGARATRALIFQITAGLFILNYLISDRNKIFTSKKLLFVFLFLLSCLIYKNALGRSDAAHIRGSHDIPILINCIFILNYLLIFFEKNFFTKRFLNYKTFFTLSLVFLLFYYINNYNRYNINNIKNYKKNFISFLNLEDEIFLNKNTIKLINYYEPLAEEDGCITNITYKMDAITYLLKKPSCTKYWTAWLTSPTALQKDYINEIKITQPKYILYAPGGDIDGLELHERINLVSEFILSNYIQYDSFGEYMILRKK